MPVLVGTSGWQYRHWRDGFYPRDIPQRRWLGYLRFHEGTGDPWPGYRAPALRDWAQRGARTWPEPGTVYAYFNNDQGGAAVRDAAAFAEASVSPQPPG